MFCEALVRTHDPRRIDVLIDLIDDDDVAGHPIAALRQCGYRRRVPEPDRVRPKPEAVLKRNGQGLIGARPGPFAKRQARNALAAIDRANAGYGRAHHGNRRPIRATDNRQSAWIRRSLRSTIPYRFEYSSRCPGRHWYKTEHELTDF
jgi:hypothetical protein